MPAPSKAPAQAREPFVVCLNPSFPEANSWWDPLSEVNLFLVEPFSRDLSDLPEHKRTAVYKAIETGLLIVAEGELPESFDRSKINRIAAGRMRIATANWDADLNPNELKQQTDLVSRLTTAIRHHDDATAPLGAGA